MGQARCLYYAVYNHCAWHSSCLKAEFLRCLASLYGFYRAHEDIWKHKKGYTPLCTPIHFQTQYSMYSPEILLALGELNEHPECKHYVAHSADYTIVTREDYRRICRTSLLRIYTGATARCGL